MGRMLYTKVSIICNLSLFSDHELKNVFTIMFISCFSEILNAFIFTYIYMSNLLCMDQPGWEGEFLDHS